MNTTTDTQNSVKMLLDSVKFSTAQVDRKLAPWDENYRPHWILHFSCERRRASFDFWNNINNEEPKRNEMLEMLLSDATAGLESFGEFCGNMGYDTDSRKAEQSHKACQKCAEKLQRLLDCGEDELYDLINYLHDEANG